MEQYLYLVAALVAMTNYCTQELKELTKGHVHTNVVAMAVSEALSIGWQAFDCMIHGTAFLPEVIPAAILGAAVGFTAMFGFDKFQEVLEFVNKLKSTDEE